MRYNARPDMALAPWPEGTPSRGRPRRDFTSFPRNRHRSHLRPHRHAGLAEGGTGEIVPRNAGIGKMNEDYFPIYDHKQLIWLERKCIDGGHFKSRKTPPRTPPHKGEGPIRGDRADQSMVCICCDEDSASCLALSKARQCGGLALPL